VHAEGILASTRQVSSVTEYFETEIKRDFNPYSPDCEEEYELYLRGSPDIPQVGLKDGYLKISKLN
jgi:hypothetical protein